MPNPQHLTTAEVAAALGRDVRTVHRMVADGRLTPAFKMPGLRGPFVFAPEEVERAKREEPAA